MKQSDITYIEDRIATLKQKADYAVAQYNNESSAWDLSCFMRSLLSPTISFLVNDKYDTDVTGKRIFDNSSIEMIFRYNKLPKESFKEYLFDEDFEKSDAEYLAWAKESKKQLKKLWKSYQDAKKVWEQISGE